MKNYKVKALRGFTDSLENIKRKLNDVFECDKERYEYLKSKGAVELIDIQITTDDIEEVTINQHKEFNTEIKKEDLEYAVPINVMEEIVTKEMAKRNKKKTSKK